MKNVAVEIRNLCSNNSGIAAFTKPLLAALITKNESKNFLLIGPDFDQSFLPRTSNYQHVKISNLDGLPRPISQFRFLLSDYYLFPQTLKRLEFDIFFSPYYDFYIPRELTDKAIITIHDLCYLHLPRQYPAKIKWYYSQHLKRNAKSAGKILTVSETTKQDLIQMLKVPEEKISVIYNSLDPIFAATQPDHEFQKQIEQTIKKNNELLCLYTGGIDYRKNLDNLLKSLQIINKKTDIKLKLIITGSLNTYYNRLKPLLKELEIEKYVVFTGYLSREQQKQYYYLCDLVVYPSLLEGFGIVTIEAMSVAKPLVCSDIPIMREVGGDYPIYCDPYSPSSIAEKILVALQTQKHPTTDSRFDLKSNIEKFLSLFQ